MCGCPPRIVLDAEGKGFKVAMAILNNGRTGLGGGAVGGMKTLIALATGQAQARRQFGQPIAEFELIREKISQMTIECFAAESVVWMVAHHIDSGLDDYSVEAAISKVYASEAIQRGSLRGAADRGRQRLHARLSVRAGDARCANPDDIRGDQRGAAALHRAVGPEGSGQIAGRIERAAVDEIFNHPIKGFGVLADYAEKRLTPRDRGGARQDSRQDPGAVARSGGHL